MDGTEGQFIGDRYAVAVPNKSFQSGHFFVFFERGTGGRTVDFGFGGTRIPGEAEFESERQRQAAERANTEKMIASEQARRRYSEERLASFPASEVTQPANLSTPFGSEYAAPPDIGASYLVQERAFTPSPLEPNISTGAVALGVDEICVA